jgi:hypothetical protein
MHLGRDYWTTSAIRIDRFHQQIDVFSNKMIANREQPLLIVLAILSYGERLEE